MNKNYLFLAAAILCFLIPFGCKRDKHVLSPYAMVATGESLDSLVLEMNRVMMTYGNPEILDSMVNVYCALSSKEDLKKQYEHRRLYWKGNALFMQGNFEKGDSLRRLALTECDSSMFPYDYRLYRMAVEQPSDFPDNSARYERYKSDLDFFSKSEDNVSAFSRAVMLMGLMNDAGMTKEALKYAVASDSLLSEADLPLLRETNRVNLASAYYACGDTVKAIDILKSLKSNGNSYAIPSIGAIIDYNLFQMTDDSLALQRAWNRVNNTEELTKMRALVAASIINRGGEINEEHRKALELSLEFDYSPEEDLEISEAFLNLAETTRDSSLIGDAADNYKKTIKRYKDEQRRGEIISAETNEIIREIEEKERLEKEHIREWTWIGITIAVLLLGITINIAYRYVNRLKRNMMFQQLEHERLRREHIAKDLMLVEKQKLNEQLQDRIEELVAEKELEIKTAEMITELIEETENENTLSTDENEFLRLFIERYPKVKKTGRKLALYIRKGLDTVQIAQEMNIRKESVIQGRWRLRTQMELDSDTDLDVELRKI